MLVHTTTRPLDHLHARDVTRLVQARAWPSVTLLLDTTPGDTMSAADTRRLTALVRDAEQQLARRQAGSVILVDRLRTLAADASHGPTGHALVLLVSQAVQRSYRLPSPVQARAVVERTFATRDLVHTLHRTPPHLLLVLTPLCAQLFRGYADTLVPVQQGGFPVQHRLPVLGELGTGDDRLEEFLDRVDSELGRVRAEHPAPLVVAGSREVVSALVRRGRSLQRLGGVLTGPVVDRPADLYAAARLSLEEYLLSREEEALIDVAAARGRDEASVATGIESCWAALRTRRPSLLVVEEGYRFPAVVDGGRLRPATGEPLETPVGDLRHDLVDDLIEIVIDRGGWVAFARDGGLADAGRVALVLADPMLVDPVQADEGRRP